MKPRVHETEPAGTDDTPAPISRIGPNAITRLGEAVEARLGRSAGRELFLRAGLVRYLMNPPSDMVDEREVIALHAALRASYPPEIARELSWQAGLLTGDYLLANRIPRLAQVVLKILPRSWASRVLTRAIARHAWTFVGSGTFRVVSAMPLRLEIAGSPLCRDGLSATPLCDYYAGTFTRVFERLVDRRWRIIETQCGAQGSGTCVFEVEQRYGS